MRGPVNQFCLAPSNWCLNLKQKLTLRLLHQEFHEFNGNSFRRRRVRFSKVLFTNTRNFWNASQQDRKPWRLICKCLGVSVDDSFSHDPFLSMHCCQLHTNYYASHEFPKHIVFAATFFVFNSAKRRESIQGASKGIQNKVAHCIMLFKLGVKLAALFQLMSKCLIVRGEDLWMFHFWFGMWLVKFGYVCWGKKPLNFIWTQSFANNPIFVALHFQPFCFKYFVLFSR